MSLVRCLLIGAIVATGTIPAFSDEKPALWTAGCEAYVNVQMSNCRVRHQFRCPDGTQLSVHYDPDGKLYEQLIDQETRWLVGRSAVDGSTEVMGPDESDPASLSTLLNTGVDTYAFSQVANGRAKIFVEGEDRLTGNRTVIDGEELLETNFLYTVTTDDGRFVMTRKGQQFVHPGFGFFVGTTEEATNWLGQTDVEHSEPRDFVFPSDADFGSIKPAYGCGAAVASAVSGSEDRG
jgi:hypothetical protein